MQTERWSPQPFSSCADTALWLNQTKWRCHAVWDVHGQSEQKESQQNKDMQRFLINCMLI